MKLTEHTRKLITSAILTHRFQKDRDALHKHQHSVAAAVYDHAFTDKQQLLMNSLPEGWLPSQARFNVQVAGNWKVLHLATPRKFPVDKHSAPIAVLDARHPISEKVSVYENAVNELKKNTEAATQSIKQVMQPCNTVNQLLTAWPEAAPVIRAALPVSTGTAAQLPALRMKDINEELKLPPKTKVK